MGNQPHPVIIPVEQATISFYSYPVIAVRLPDGRVGAVLRTMCEALQLDRPSQVRRIREDETITDCLVLVQVETSGGPQATDVLTAWAIPYWLSNIQLSRVAPEKREAISAFKREAADVLYRHFSQRPAQPPAHALVPAEPMSRPIQPSPSAPADEWATYHEQMALFYRWKGTIDARLDTVDIRLNEVEQRQDEMEGRVEGMEEVVRLVPEILERLGPQTLTPQHQRQVQVSVQRLSKATGKHSATIYNDLYTAFSVPRYQDIPESDWEQVVQWFQVQIERAKNK